MRLKRGRLCHQEIFEIDLKAIEDRTRRERESCYIKNTRAKEEVKKKESCQDECLGETLKEEVPRKKR